MLPRVSGIHSPTCAMKAQTLMGAQVNLPICVSFCRASFLLPLCNPNLVRGVVVLPLGHSGGSRDALYPLFLCHPAILNILTLYLLSHSHNQCPGFALMSVAPLLWVVQSSWVSCLCLSCCHQAQLSSESPDSIALLPQTLLWNEALAPWLHGKRLTWSGPGLVFQAYMDMPL